MAQPPPRPPLPPPTLPPPRRPLPALPPDRLDVVIAATHADLSWLEAWRPQLQGAHLIIVSAEGVGGKRGGGGEAGVGGEGGGGGSLRAPDGFDYEHYTR